MVTTLPLSIKNLKKPEMDAMMPVTVSDNICLNFIIASDDYPVDEMRDYLIEVFVNI